MTGYNPQVGDRVRMIPGRTYLGSEVPDLGVGTVVATEGEHLMTGWYVEVTWDAGYGREARYPAADAIEPVDPGWCPGCGHTFKGKRGLRTHQHARFTTVACRPTARRS